MPNPGGHTVSVVAACGRSGQFSHSTPKELFVCRAKITTMKSLPAEDSAEKRVQKGEAENIAVFCCCDIYLLLNVR